MWFGRFLCRKGYGVQSPLAYRFIRSVVAESWPYYAYDELRKNVKCRSKAERRKCEFYLRLSNYLQPSLWLDSPFCEDASREYIAAGCRRVKFESLSTSDFADQMAQAGVIRFFSQHDPMSAYQSVLPFMAFDSVLIVEDLQTDKTMSGFWKEIAGSDAVTLSFDLDQLGIAFYMKRSQKQHYELFL